MRPLPLLALCLAAAAPAAPDPVGRYRLTGEHDVVSELVIARGGRFQYGLIAGALDEEASGRWQQTGSQIRLTTLPKPVPPSFAAGAAKRSADGRLVLHVVWPNGHDAVGTDLKIDFESGPPLLTYVGGPDGWTLPDDEARRPVAVTLQLSMFGFVSPRFPIDTAGGSDLSFVITPHDLGRIAFDGFPIDVQPGKLIVHRGEATLTYVRVP
jgi:hypothetical protein